MNIRNIYFHAIQTFSSLSVRIWKTVSNVIFTLCENVLVSFPPGHFSGIEIRPERCGINTSRLISPFSRPKHTWFIRTFWKRFEYDFDNLILRRLTWPRRKTPIVVLVLSVIFYGVGREQRDLSTTKLDCDALHFALTNINSSLTVNHRLIHSSTTHNLYIVDEPGRFYDLTAIAYTWRQTPYATRPSYILKL